MEIIKRDDRKRIVGYRNIDKATCSELGGEYIDGVCYIEEELTKNGKILRRPNIEIKDYSAHED